MTEGGKRRTEDPGHLAGDGAGRFLPHDDEHFRATKCADKHRQKAKPAFKVANAIGEAGIGMDALLPDHGDK